MSAATRRPYLGEIVHVATFSERRGKRCRPAMVTDIVEDKIELWLISPPAPRFIQDPPHSEEDRTKGTYHWAH